MLIFTIILVLLKFQICLCFSAPCLLDLQRIDSVNDISKWINELVQTDASIEKLIHSLPFYESLVKVFYELSLDVVASLFLLPHLQAQICNITDEPFPQKYSSSPLGLELEDRLAASICPVIEKGMDRLLAVEQMLIRMHKDSRKYVLSMKLSDQSILDLFDQLHLQPISRKAIPSTVREPSISLEELYVTLLKLVFTEETLLSLIHTDPIYLNLAQKPIQDEWVLTSSKSHRSLLTRSTELIFLDVPTPQVDETLTLRFVVLLRMLESIQVLLHKRGFSVPTPLFRIATPKIKFEMTPKINFEIVFPTTTDRFAEMLQHNSLHDLLILERRAVKVVDAVLKGRCNVLGKPEYRDFCEICQGFSKAQIELYSQIKPYSDLYRPRCQASQFNPIKVIGEGRMGKVYLCHGPFGKLMAVKVIPKETSRRYIICANRKVRILMQNRQVNDVTRPFLLDGWCAFQTKNYAFIAMKYQPGRNLPALLASLSAEAPMGEIERLVRFYTAQTILALANLHQRHILHGDLQPSAIMIDARGNVRLGHFSRSKIQIPGRLFEARETVPSPYHPPEMQGGSCFGGYGLEVDWYMLGVTVFELLTRSPFPIPEGDHQVQRNKIIHFTSSQSLSIAARQFIYQLTNPNPSLRLASFQGIQNHPWFSSLDWGKIASPVVADDGRPPLARPVEAEMIFYNGIDDLFTPFEDLKVPMVPPHPNSLEFLYYQFGKYPNF